MDNSSFQYHLNAKDQCFANNFRPRTTPHPKKKKIHPQTTQLNNLGTTAQVANWCIINLHYTRQDSHYKCHNVCQVILHTSSPPVFVPSPKHPDCLYTWWFCSFTLKVDFSCSGQVSHMGWGLLLRKGKLAQALPTLALMLVSTVSTILTVVLVLI